jgi:hypothetical protein
MLEEVNLSITGELLLTLYLLFLVRLNGMTHLFLKDVEI